MTSPLSRGVFRLVISLLAVTAVARAQGPASLVADVNPFTAITNPGSSPELGAQVGTSGPIVFAATHANSGAELWRVSSTGLSPSLVCDIRPGTAGSNPSGFVTAGNLVFFLADDGSHGQEVWRTDGTTAGTWLVRDIMPGPASCTASSLVAFQGQLWFRANNGVNGHELWSSNGTLAGTTIVVDLEPGPVSSFATELTVVGSTLYFAASTTAYGNELWKSGGSQATTVLVRDIRGGDLSSAPQQLTAVGSLLYFSADTPASGRELWKSDGTTAGTVMVEEILSGSLSSTPQNLTAVGSLLYFTAVQSPTGREPWVSDGTSAGTSNLRDIRFGTTGSDPAEFVARGSTLIFTADDGVNGRELWKSDGTPVGTVLVSDIRAGAASSLPSGLTLIEQGTGPLTISYVYFTATDGINGGELWRSNGTAAGTVMVADLVPGAGGSGPSEFLQTAGLRGSSFLFRASGPYGHELWRSNGSAASTTSFDLNPPAADSRPELLAADGTRSFFTADDGVTGRELWVTNGTAAGTMRLADIMSGPGSSFPHGGVMWNGRLYFAAESAGAGVELWRSDGTTLGTQLVADTNPGPADGNPLWLTVFAGNLYFSADDGSGGRELWRSTLFGTARLLDLEPGAVGSDPAELTVFGSRLVFVATTSAEGRELFATPGTAFGTGLLADVVPGIAGSNPVELTAAGNLLYFRASDGVTGPELWRSDGTGPGTTQVIDLWPGATGANPTGLTALQFVPGTWTLCFVANNQVFGSEVFRSDGTQAGTIPVRDVWPGAGSSSPTALTRMQQPGGDLLLFAAADGTAGLEPFRSSGTPASTIRLFDIQSGIGSSFPPTGGWFLALPNGRQVLFPASDRLTGLELWRHDVVTGITSLHQDVNAGPAPGNPTLPLLMGARLVFTANDGTYGSEPWSMATMAIAPLYGQGCGGSSSLTAELQPTDTPYQGNASFGYQIAGAPPLRGAFLLFDFQRSNVGYGACTVLVQPYIVHFLVTSGAGSATFPLPVSSNPAFLGMIIDAQALILDQPAPIAGLLSATNAVEVILGPN